MEAVEAVIVGGGVVGVSIARALALSGLECLVIERNRKCGQETTSRSSEVLHAGIYYSTNSLKAKFCIEGRNLLTQYMRERNIEFNLCGKLIVSNQEDTKNRLLLNLYTNGLKNGLDRLELWDSSMVACHEPEVIASKAIWSPYSGIFDSQGVLNSFLADIESSGSSVCTNCQFLDAVRMLRNGQKFYRISTSKGPLLCRYLINSAGLNAQLVAKRIQDATKYVVPGLYLAKGNYFKLSGSKKLFNHLIYPLPEPAGLGVHVTMDICGNIRFGPDVEWLRPKRPFLDEFQFNPEELDELELDVDESRKAKFLDSVKRFWPKILDLEGQLMPDYAGIRPKLAGPKDNEGYQDFLVQDELEYGCGGLINIFGIESPGWTSCIALGKHVKDLLVMNDSI